MRISEILKAAREMIYSPEHWVQNSFAVTKSGVPVDPSNPGAYAFCLSGAVRAVCHSTGTDELELRSRSVKAHWLLGQTAYEIIGNNSNIYQFNDCHTHEEVINLLDKTINLL